jgi:hypothetical protein
MRRRRRTATPDLALRPDRRTSTPLRPPLHLPSSPDLQRRHTQASRPGPWRLAAVPRCSSPTIEAHHPLLRRRRPRRRPQPHRAHSAAWGPSTAAGGSGAAPGAQPRWGFPPSTTDGRPSAGSASRRTRGAAGHRTKRRKRGNDGGAMEGHGSASVALQPAVLHRQQHQPTAALQHQPAAAAVTREAGRRD